MTVTEMKEIILAATWR